MGVVPRVSGVAVAHLIVRRAAAPAARRILALALGLRGLGLGLVLDLGLDVGGDGFLAGNPNHVM